MGNCDSASAEMSKRSRKINVQLEQDKKAEDTIIKLLLLGENYVAINENKFFFFLFLFREVQRAFL